MSTGAVPNEPPKTPLMTDLYFVGGVPSEISESNLLNFFSQFVTIDAISFRPFKKPASKGFAFLRTSELSDLVGLVGTKLKLLNESLTLQPADCSKDKILTLRNNAQRKVFFGRIPQEILPEQLIAAIQSVGPVERITRMRLMSDRTKYCYAIMQHLDHAQQLAAMKTFNIVDPVSKENRASLLVDFFVPKSQSNAVFLKSKFESQTQEMVKQPLAQTLEAPEASEKQTNNSSKSVFCEETPKKRVNTGAKESPTTGQQQTAVVKPLRTME